MWQDGAHAIFLLVIVLVFNKVLQNSLDFGKKLRRLRDTCGNVADDLKEDKTPDPDDIVVMVRNKATGDIIYERHCDADKKEINRLMNDNDLREQVITFKHLPEAENLSHIVGIFKESSETYDCIACIST